MTSFCFLSDRARIFLWSIFSIFVLVCGSRIPSVKAELTLDHENGIIRDGVHRIWRLDGKDVSCLVGDDDARDGQLSSRSNIETSRCLVRRSHGGTYRLDRDVLETLVHGKVSDDERELDVQRLLRIRVDGNQLIKSTLYATALETVVIEIRSRGVIVVLELDEFPLTMVEPFLLSVSSPYVWLEVSNVESVQSTKDAWKGFILVRQPFTQHGQVREAIPIVDSIREASSLGRPVIVKMDCHVPKQHLQRKWQRLKDQGYEYSFPVMNEPQTNSTVHQRLILLSMQGDCDSSSIKRLRRIRRLIVTVDDQGSSRRRIVTTVVNPKAATPQPALVSNDQSFYRDLSDDDDDDSDSPTSRPTDDGGLSANPGTLPPALLPNQTGVGAEIDPAVAIGVGLGAGTIIVSLSAIGFIMYAKRRQRDEETRVLQGSGFGSRLQDGRAMIANRISRAATGFNYPSGGGGGMMNAAAQIPYRMSMAMRGGFTSSYNNNTNDAMMMDNRSPPPPASMMSRFSSASSTFGNNKPKNSANPTPASTVSTLTSFSSATGGGGGGYPPTPVTMAKVVYDYRANGPSELNLVTGDTIQVTQRVYGGWYEGKNLRTGATGIFPEQHVRMSTPIPSDTSASGFNGSGGGGGTPYPQSQQQYPPSSSQRSYPQQPHQFPGGSRPNQAPPKYATSYSLSPMSSSGQSMGSSQGRRPPGLSSGGYN